MRLQNNIRIIISGGQTGVDRAALDFAMANKISSGGWCPQGRLAEDGPLNVRYPLSETWLPDLLIRTEMNVIDSDATLILIFDEMDNGTRLTTDLARDHQKPVFVWKIGQNRNFMQFQNWLQKNNVSTLNVAGPRESNAPGIYRASLDILGELLGTAIYID